jgi:hypothetical protein
MAEVVGIISGVVRETKGFAQGLTLFLCGATSRLFLWLSESPLVSLERISIVVTLDHSPFVDFDIQLFDADTDTFIRDCGSNVVPEVCVVSFAVRSRDIAVDIVITSFVGAGSYTLTLDAQ